MYKESYYNFKETVETGDTVLYNSRTGAIAVVEPESKDKVFGILGQPDEHTEEEYFQPLLDNGFLVKSDFDEIGSIKERYDKEFHRKDIITVVLLPAEICNFTCEYCFIYNYKGKIMSQEVYDSITKYIEHKIEEFKQSDSKAKKPLLRVSWFGGEPLLAREDILKYMEFVKEKFGEECELYGDIITNGYYLDYNMFKQLLDHDVIQYQVTFDGAKEDHNKTRCLHNGEGSYDIIMSNIKDIVSNIKPEDKFRLSLRINFMKNTYEKIYGLIDELHDIIGDDRRFNIYTRPIYNFDTKRDTIDELKDNIFTLDDGLEQQTDFALYIDEKFKRKIVERSVNDYLPLPTRQWCSEDNDYSIIIGADASVYSCDSLVGDESVSVGKLNKDGIIQFKDNVDSWKKSIFEFENFKECMKCKCLPACLGCCRRERVMDNVSTPCLFTEESIRATIREHFVKKNA